MSPDPNFFFNCRCAVEFPMIAQKILSILNYNLCNFRLFPNMWFLGYRFIDISAQMIKNI